MGEEERETPVEKLKKEASGKLIVVGIGCALIATGIVVTVIGIRPLLRTWEKIKEKESEAASSED